jgi:hypothetical protein
MSQRSLITDAARLALLAQIKQLGVDINTHINGGIDQHDTQVILDEPFISAGGDTLTTKTLKIGVVVNGVNAFILLPVIA